MEKSHDKKWNKDTPIDEGDFLTQREARAKVFQLKKWIRSIEEHPDKTTVMRKKLELYRIELNELQSRRMAYNGKRIL